jgi:para-nitrobenzyl esterase
MSAEPVVRLPQGLVGGTWRDVRAGEGATRYHRSAAFLGIPFAEPPVGRNRFGAPVPARGWDEVRAATRYGPTAQRRQFAEVTAIPEPSLPGEATLNVNVFTPAPGDREARLPVLVWIHGGGYKAGSPASPWYDGLAFNRDGVVTVTISYRLGFDGFGFIPDAPHNRGLLDQLEALRWVQRSVAAFGGDPRNVTIAGQSAGGGSVWALLISPLARGLFHAAISQSGALSLQSPDVARSNGRSLAERAGVEWTRAGLSAVHEDRILDHQEQPEFAEPPASLGEAVGRIHATGGVSLAFQPYRDDDLFPADVEQSLLARTAAAVPLLMGSTAHEFTAAGPVFAPLLATGDLGATLDRGPLGSAAADYLATCADLPGGEASILGQLVTDSTFRLPLVRRAELRHDPTWLYDFRLVHRDTGLSSHCADLPFTWDLLDAPQVIQSCDPDPPQTLADAMHGAWVEFVRTHRVPWPRWPADGLAMVFDRESAVRPAFALERRVAEVLAARADAGIGAGR